MLFKSGVYPPQFFSLVVLLMLASFCLLLDFSAWPWPCRIASAGAYSREMVGWLTP